MNNLEKNISPEIKETIKLILKKMPTAVFGGSIALNAVGLIDRKVGDIDLFMLEGKSLNKRGFSDLASEFSFSGFHSDFITNVNGYDVQRVGLKHGTTQICLFKVRKEELQHSFINFEGMEMRIQNVNYAIYAKATYFDATGKHSIDIQMIENTLNKLFK